MTNNAEARRNLSFRKFTCKISDKKLEAFPRYDNPRVASQQQ